VAVRAEAPQAVDQAFCLKHHMRAIGGGDCPGCVYEISRRLEVPDRALYEDQPQNAGVAEFGERLDAAIYRVLTTCSAAPFADAMAEGLLP
jgi:hypothetical protein